MSRYIDADDVIQKILDKKDYFPSDFNDGLDAAIEVITDAAEETDIPIYDKETRHENCTVQILENTKTGKISIGWWEK